MIEGLYNFATKWSEKGSVWLYSDSHFGDKELAKSISGRPSAEEQVKAINKCVGKNDTFVCLGDVGDVEYVRQIHGYKVLITGNHDKGIEAYKRKKETIFISFSGLTLKEISVYVRKHYPMYKGWDMSIENLNYPSKTEQHYSVTFDNKLFDEVYDGPLMISPKILLSHEPVDIDWAFNIHGHTHNLVFDTSKHKCVNADVIKYKPISLAEIIKSGRTAEATPLHRTTIDKATENKKKREKRKKLSIEEIEGYKLYDLIERI